MDYELTVVMAEKTTPAKKKSTSEMIDKLVKTFGGTVKKTTEWGLIPLSYFIKKNSSGIFVHYILELSPKAAKDLENKIRLEEGIIRHLIVKGDK